MPVRISSTTVVAMLPSLTMVTCLRPPSRRTATTVLFRWISTPSWVRAWETICAASRSSFGRNSGALWQMRVRQPKRAKAWASSQPSGPPPMTSRLGGSAVSSKTVSLVR